MIKDAQVLSVFFLERLYFGLGDSHLSMMRSKIAFLYIETSISKRYQKSQSSFLLFWKFPSELSRQNINNVQNHIVLYLLLFQLCLQLHVVFICGDLQQTRVLLHLLDSLFSQNLYIILHIPFSIKCNSFCAFLSNAYLTYNHQSIIHTLHLVLNGRLLFVERSVIDAQKTHEKFFLISLYVHFMVFSEFPLTEDGKLLNGRKHILFGLVIFRVDDL